jgi:PAS domain S-box-containing protein
MLLHIVSGRPDEAFDRLLRLAQRLLKAPIALISLVDDETHDLKSVQGLPEPWASQSQMPFSQSICQHVVKRATPMVIGNAATCSLVADPAITDLGIGAYLGVPLHASTGETVGALSVMDHQARDWSEEEVATLADVGQAVMAEIEARLYRHGRELAEAARQASEARTAEILESIDEAFYVVDRQWTLTYVNRKAEQLWRKRREDVLGHSLLDVLPRFAGSQSHAAHEQALSENKPVELRTYSAATGVPIEIAIYPSFSGLSVYIRDISERQRLERELRERDETLSLAERSAGIGVWDIDLASGLVRGTPQFFRIMGLEATPLPVSIEVLRAQRHPADRERVVQGFREAVTSGSDSYEMEYRILRPDGQTRWIFGRGRVIRDADGEPVRYSGVDIDITERKQAEEHRVLLVNELNHRVKNILATVQAIASQTFRNSSVELEVRNAFEGRILALSKGHNLLTAENWSGAGLRQLVAETLQPFGIGGHGAQRISVHGSEIKLPSRIALALSMALHELATNAAKYGALSNDTGRIAIVWEVNERPRDKQLRLLWQETQGPTVQQVRRKGFGSQLIEKGLALELNGEVRLDYRPEGVICEITMLLSDD